MNQLGSSYQHKKLSYDNLKIKIKKNEGFSQKPYKDQLGFYTIGFGHLIMPSEKHLVKKNINVDELEKLFDSDFKKTLKNYKIFLKKFPSSKIEEDLLIEMVFQIGISGVLKFKKLLYNMKQGNTNLVCFEMMNSLWYKQTPNRVKNLIIVFLKNER